MYGQRMIAIVKIILFNWTSVRHTIFFTLSKYALFFPFHLLQINNFAIIYHQWNKFSHRIYRDLFSMRTKWLPFYFYFVLKHKQQKSESFLLTFLIVMAISWLRAQTLLLFVFCFNRQHAYADTWNVWIIIYYYTTLNE